MREILFRGKRLDNGEWMQGYYAFHTNGLKDESYKEYHIIQPLQANGRFDVLRDVDPETVGQYTGLADKNGKKIFEGDCWLDTDGGDYLAYVVEFRDGQFGFVCYGIRGMLMPYGYDDEAGGWGEIDFYPFTDYYIDEIEIVGNIHDNPELIGGADNEYK